jgi:serine/threonine protein kinase
LTLLNREEIEAGTFVKESDISLLKPELKTWTWAPQREWSTKSQTSKIIVISADPNIVSPVLSSYTAVFGKCRGRRVCIKVYKCSPFQIAESNNARQGQVADENSTVIRAVDQSIQDSVYELRSITHPNIARLLHISLSGIKLTMTYEFCGPGVLEDVLERRRIPLDMNLRLLLVNGLLNGLAHIHDTLSSSHGSLNCRNCFIDNSWNLKIGGFGLAFANRVEEKNQVLQSFVGPEFMGSYPDLGVGSKAGDIYSAAMMLYSILYQRLPFTDKYPVFSSLATDTAGKIRPSLTSEISTDFSNVYFKF